MAVGSVSPFRPSSTTGLSTTSVSANVVLAGGGDSVVVTNPSSVLTYVKFGSDPSIVASTSDMPILPGSRLILSINSLIAFAAALAPSGNGSLLFTRGDGSII